MRRNKNAYMNFVCPNCYNKVNKCVCETFPPYHLILIDENIQEHIRILNEKGYRTMYCCEAHCVASNTYITFVENYFNEVAMPNEFKYDSKKRTISHIYSAKMTKEEFEITKRKNLITLLEWCNSLPDRKNVGD
jgi:hypothetical protein